MSTYIYLFSLLFVFSSLQGQFASGTTQPDRDVPLKHDFEDLSYKFSSTITKTDLNEYLSVLSSDLFEGRETGTPGNAKAADYIAGKFAQLGLPKIGNDESYFQNVAITFTSWKTIEIDIANQKLKLLKDYVAFPQHSIRQEIISGEIHFLGYGIEDQSYSDYTLKNVQGKILMVFDGEPTNVAGESLISGNMKKSQWSENWQLKSILAKKKGADLLIIVSNDLQNLVSSNRSQFINRMTQLGDFGKYEAPGVNTVFISSRVAEEILGSQRDEIIALRNALINGENNSISLDINSKVNAKFEVKREVLNGRNILGYIEGTDKKDEVVIVSAHYDHVGKKGTEVYNGADDNASGTSTVLEIAEALATAKRMKQGPRRSVLCLLLTGEEKGLLGSEYYMAHPVFPIQNTVVDVNIDMVGRRGKEYESRADPYIYVIGSDRLSTDLHHINEDINEKYSHLLLDYKYNDEKDPNRFYYRSDHYNFAKQGIPSIFFFNGVHSDYHRLTDTIDKIDFSLLNTRARHIFHLIWELSNRKERIKVNGHSPIAP